MQRNLSLVKTNKEYKMSFYIKDNMLSKAILLVFLVFSFYGSGADQTASNQAEHPYFWKVEKGGKASYLLGTFHGIITIDELICPQEIQHQLENSDLLLVESDYRSEQHQDFMDTVQQMKISTDGREFQQLRKETQDFFRSRGVSKNLNFYGYSIAFHQLCYHGVEYTRGLILDDRITNAAYSNGISVWELEKDTQYSPAIKKKEKKVSAYNQLSKFRLRRKIYLLNEKIRQFDNKCPPKQLIENIENYKSGKGIEDFKKYMNDLTPKEKAADIAIMKERNLQWLKRFEEAYQSHEGVFLAGGLAHFVEPFNFMDLLRERGYAVKPVICER